MLKTLSHLGAYALLTVSLATGMDAAAAPVDADESAPIIPIEADRAAAIARENTGGRVLDVRPLADDSGRSYAVRLLLDPGRVRTVLVDGDSGQLH